MQQPAMLFGQPQGNGLVTDLSQQDFSDHMPHVGGTGGLNVQFFYNRVRTDDPVDPSRNGQWKVVLCVAKQPKGDRLTVATRMISEAQAQRLFPREFAFFKQSQDVPTDGTPLNELPGITMSQIGILMVHGIRSIEDLVAQPQEHVNAMGMDAIACHTLARKWVERQKSDGDLIRSSQTEAAQAAELTRLRRVEAESSARITALTAQVEMLARLSGNGATAPSASAVTAIDVDDGVPDALPDDGLFSGGDMARGADDLDEAAPPPAARGRKRNPLDD